MLPLLAGGDSGASPASPCTDIGTVWGKCCLRANFQILIFFLFSLARNLSQTLTSLCTSSLLISLFLSFLLSEYILSTVFPSFSSLFSFCFLSHFWMKPWQLLLILSVAIRLALVVYSEIYDSQAAATDVQYTDVDYRVAVEAGQLMWPVAANSTSDLVRVASRNPFSRHTFRYTPLLALLASIDTIVGPGSLKVVYCAVDAVVGYLLLVSFAVPWPLVAAGYLLNPIVIGVTSRGNAEAITVLSVLLLLRASMPRTRQPMVMGILLAWAIHWRLYPVIFAPALLMVLFCAADPGAEQGRQVQHDSGIFALLRSWQHWRVVLGPLFDFALGLLAALSALTLLGYWW